MTCIGELGETDMRETEPLCEDGSGCDVHEDARGPYGKRASEARLHCAHRNGERICAWVCSSSHPRGQSDLETPL